MVIFPKEGSGEINPDVERRAFLQICFGWPYAASSRCVLCGEGVEERLFISLFLYLQTDVTGI